MRRLFYAGKVTGWMIRFVFRFLAGRNLFGPRRTDATFLQPATRQLDQNAPALHRWETQRGLSRALWRMAGGYLLLLNLILILLRGVEALHPLPWILHPTTLLLLHVSLAGIAGASFLLIRRARDYGYSYPILIRDDGLAEDEEKLRTIRAMPGDDLLAEILEEEIALGGRERLRISWISVEGRRAWLEEKILPISRSVSVILGHSIPDRKALGWVTVPKNYREPGGAPVEIRLPAHFTGADAAIKTRLERSVSAKLGMPEVSARWETEGSSPRVLLSSPPEPPELIGFSDVEHFLSAQGEWDFLYGMTGSGESFSISVTGDTPHGAVSSGSGGGKSELLKGITAQAGHKGWFTVILDYKEESQPWARNLDGVRYVTSIGKIHDMCVEIGEELMWRKENPDAPRPRLLILAEEWSATAPQLTEYYQILRATEPDPDARRAMPPRSPAISAITNLIFMGRALGVFLQFVAIRFSARVTNGNADLRESFQVINMARYKPQTVKMLAPDVKPFPRKSKIPGRWVAVNGDEAVVYQGVLWSDEAATAWHQSGTEIQASPFSERYRPTDPTVSHVHSGQETQLGHDPTGPNWDVPAIEGEIIDQVDARKLSEMVDGLAHLDVTLNVLQMAVKRDESFPGAFGGNQFKGYTYDFEQVKEWARRRYASQKVGRG
jgi:hypothetical protein